MHTHRVNKVTALISMIFTFISFPLLANINKEIRDLEKISKGRIGISAINTANNAVIHYRDDERFPMGCTSKVLGVAAILKKNELQSSFMEEKIKFAKKDILDWAPITSQHLADGMTVTELCAAAISYSDNTAMNLLTKKLNGPQGINNFARSIGDTQFQLDHWWPDEARSGPEGFDSSTPSAMRESLFKIVLGDVLKSGQREQLATWLKKNTTGNYRIRAGVPKNWIVGDKTGTGFYYGTTNDIAIIWPPGHPPLVLAIFYTSQNKNSSKREDVIAAATRLVIRSFAHDDRQLQ
jgi:beta-lactamase class A